MPSETITVYIDPSQLAAQKNNNYSLFLAKLVNGEYTIIWQSMGPLATVNTSSYEYENVFNIAIPSYEVSYGNVTMVNGTVSFTSSGQPTQVYTGQTIALNATGLFGAPTNTGTAGVITVNNSLQGNPNEILLDSDGNTIFVNTTSGMDIGTSTMTPVDQYQLWFDNYQATGTIIVENISNYGTVTFSGEANQTISYTSSGQWVPGPLPAAQYAFVANTQVQETVTIVLATLSAALTAAAATWVMSKLISKFSGNLKPSSISASLGSANITIKFSNKLSATGAALTMDQYETAVQGALSAAVKDPSSGLMGDTWSLSEPSIIAVYSSSDLIESDLPAVAAYDRQVQHHRRPPVGRV